MSLRTLRLDRAHGYCITCGAYWADRTYRGKARDHARLEKHQVRVVCAEVVEFSGDDEQGLTSWFDAAMRIIEGGPFNETAAARGEKGAA